MNHIPCKKPKCLLYPACKHKRMINCVPLREYYEYYKMERGVSYDYVWKAITNVLPILQTIVGPFIETKSLSGKWVKMPEYYYQKEILDTEFMKYIKPEIHMLNSQLLNSQLRKAKK